MTILPRPPDPAVVIWTAFLALMVYLGAVALREFIAERRGRR